MIYVKVNGTEYLATIVGHMSDFNWDNRESKEIITEELTYAQANTLFVDDVQWSIVEHDGETVHEYDNSAYKVAGDITDHRHGSITIKMGKPTDLELAYEELYG